MRNIPVRATAAGVAFSIDDLEYAMAWAANRVGMLRLVVATDHATVDEAIEIFLPDAKAPRWCLWRDDSGKLHVDDWTMHKFDLPYHNVHSALHFVSDHF